MTHAIISDRAAKGIAVIFNHDEDVCDMNGSEKNGNRFIGDLSRERNRVKYFLQFALFKLHINSYPKNILFVQKIPMNLSPEGRSY